MCDMELFFHPLLQTTSGEIQKWRDNSMNYNTCLSDPPGAFDPIRFAVELQRKKKQNKKRMNLNRNLFSLKQGQ